MAKLIINYNGQQIDERMLLPGKLFIGRRGNNHIQVRSPTVSARHALIITVRNESYLEDLGSTNGTRVNGKIVKKCLLQDGDEITLAKHVLKYIHDETASELQDPEVSTVPEHHIARAPETNSYDAKTVVIEHIPKLSLEPETHSDVEHSLNKAAGIYLLSGPGMGSEIALERTLTTLGKPGIQVGVIIRREGGYFFSHIEGTHAPLINGKPVVGQACKLNDHDIIELAGTKMEFFVKDT